MGKTTVAKAIALEMGRPLLQVDDLWLAMRQVVPPDVLPALHAFSAPRTFDASPDDLFERKVELAQLMSSALEVVVANHLRNADPVVIEGVWITPTLASQRVFGDQSCATEVRAVFIDEDDEQALLASMIARGRGIETWTVAEQRTMSAMQARYATWIRREATRLSLPRVAARPQATLLERVRGALT